MKMTTDRKLTQLDAVYEHLKTGKSLTQLQALKYFGCLRLAAIIHVLRQQGVAIRTQIVGKERYARYSLCGA